VLDLRLQQGGRSKFDSGRRQIELLNLQDYRVRSAYQGGKSPRSRQAVRGGALQRSNESVKCFQNLQQRGSEGHTATRDEAKGTVLSIMKPVEVEDDKGEVLRCCRAKRNTRAAEALLWAG
jgi:hypothetical protein